MKDKLLRHIHRSVGAAEFVSALFLIFMLTVQLFMFGPRGYLNITDIKYVSFLLICGCYTAAMLALGVKGNLRPKERVSLSVTELCVVIYLALTLISAVVSEFFPDTIIGTNRREGALTIAIYCVLFLLLSRNGRAGKWFIYLLGIVISVFSSVCVLQLLDINAFWLFPDGLSYYDAGEKYSGEFLGTMGNAGLTASFLCLGAPLFLIYISRGKEKLRFWLLIPLLLSLAVLLLSRIAAGILGFFAGVFISVPFVFCSAKKIRRAMLIIELLLLAAVLAAVYFLEFEGGILYELHCILHGKVESSFGSSRIFIWRNTLPLVAQRPVFGGGPDTLAQRIGVIFETVEKDGTVRQATIDAAHNEYLHIAVCQGLPALAAYLTALISTLVRFVRSGTRDPIASALAVGMVCYCVQAFFGISMFISATYFWIVWALLESRLKQREVS